MSTSTNILVIFEDINIINILNKQFEQEFHVFQVRTLEGAYKIIDENEICIIISDRRLPDIDKVKVSKIKIILAGVQNSDELIAAINDRYIYRYISNIWDLHEITQTVLEAYNEYTSNQIVEEDINSSDDIIGQESFEKSSIFYQKALNGELITFDNVIKTKEGKDIIAQVTYSPFYENNLQTGIIIRSQDITEKKVLQRQLQESEEKFRKLFFEMKFGCSLQQIIFDDDGNPKDYITLDMNPACEVLLGIKKEEFIGIPISSVLPPSEFQEWLNIFSNVAITRKSTHYEKYSEHNHRYFEGSVYSPKYGQFAVIFDDITNRKNMEKASQESEMRYRQLVEFSPDAIATHSKGRFTFLNNAAVKLFGAKSPDDMIGKLVFDFVHPDYRNIVHSRIGDLTTQRQEVPLIEEKLLKLDGTPIDVEVAALSIDSENKSEKQIITVIRNISERKQIQYELEESEEKYRNLFYNNFTTKLIIDPETGNIIDTNQAASLMYGFSVEELKTLKIYDLNILTPEEIKKEMELASYEKSNYFNFRHRKANNDIIDVEVYSTPIKIKGKTYLHSIIHDVTERVETQKKLIQKEKLLEEAIKTRDKFFSIIAHDMRGLFNSLLGFSGILYDEFDTLEKEETKHMIEVVYRASQSAYNLLENLLQWARTQMGSMEYEPKTNDLREIIENATAPLEFQASKKNIQIHYDTIHQVEVFCDFNMITTTIRNLVSNSIKYTPMDGQINIHVKDLNVYFEISVIDSGIGIKKEILQNLFRIDVPHTRGIDNESGTGLGLILCKEFVEKHGGKIWADSTVGKGSTFTFTLPNINKTG